MIQQALCACKQHLSADLNFTDTTGLISGEQDKEESLFLRQMCSPYHRRSLSPPVKALWGQEIRIDRPRA